MVAQDHPVERRFTFESAHDLAEDGWPIEVAYRVSIPVDLFFRHRDITEKNHELCRSCLFQALDGRCQTAEMHGESGVDVGEAGESSFKTVTAEFKALWEENLKVLNRPEPMVTLLSMTS